MSLGGVSEQSEYGTFSDVGSSMAQFGLQPAVALQHDLNGQPLPIGDPRRPSQQEPVLYQLHDGPSPSSARLHSSPTGANLGRSQSTSSIEPSFASPAMIKSRSHLSHQHLGSIAEGGGAGVTNEFGQRSTSGGSAGGHSRPSVLMPVHPAHGIESPMTTDYPTPTYPAPHSASLYHSQPPSHHQHPGSHYTEPQPPPLKPMQPLRPSPVLFQASTFGASLVDAPSAPSPSLPYYDHQPLQEHHHDPHGPAYVYQLPSSAQQQHQASQYYYTPESLDGGVSGDTQSMTYMQQSNEYDYGQATSSRYATDLGVTGLMGGGEMSDMYDFETERRRDDARRRYQEHAYGVQG